MKKLIIFLFFPVVLFTQCVSSRSYTADYVFSNQAEKETSPDQVKAILDSLATVNEYRLSTEETPANEVKYTGQPYVFFSYSWENKEDGLHFSIDHGHISSRKAMMHSREFTNTLEAALKSQLEIITCNVIIDEKGGKRSKAK